MPKRRAKRTTKRRGSSAFNLKNALLSYASLHIMSENITGTSPMHFLTAGTRFSQYSASGYQQSGDKYHNIVTLQEIINGVQAGKAGAGAPSPFTQMGNNLRANILPLILSLASVRIAGKVITKLGISRQFNSLSRSLGVSSMVRM
jgi:hypothetical protein